MSSASGRDRRIGAAEQRVDRIGGRDVGREARELRALTDEELIAHVRTLALEVGDSKWSAEALDWVNRLEALRQRNAPRREAAGEPEPERFLDP